VDGLCQCGCGQPAPIAARTVRSRGRIKGQPLRYIQGHNNVGMDRSKPRKSVRYVEEDRGYTSPCWIWQLKTMKKTGYGTLGIKGKHYLAHRVYYEQARGPIPEGMQLDHLCRVRECVNPDHLEPVTPQENTRRSRAAKLGERQARMIYTLASSGEFSNAEIGRRFGVTRETVRLIRERGVDQPRRG
jgi:hypothetical protein